MDFDIPLLQLFDFHRKIRDEKIISVDGVEDIVKSSMTRDEYRRTLTLGIGKYVHQNLNCTLDYNERLETNGHASRLVDLITEMYEKLKDQIHLNGLTDDKDDYDDSNDSHDESQQLDSVNCIVDDDIRVHSDAHPCTIVSCSWSGRDRTDKKQTQRVYVNCLGSSIKRMHQVLNTKIINFKIFSFLDFLTLTNCSYVCLNWYLDSHDTSAIDHLNIKDIFVFVERYKVTRMMILFHKQLLKFIHNYNSRMNDENDENDENEIWKSRNSFGNLNGTKHLDTQTIVSSLFKQTVRRNNYIFHNVCFFDSTPKLLSGNVKSPDELRFEDEYSLPSIPDCTPICLFKTDIRRFRKISKIILVPMPWEIQSLFKAFCDCNYFKSIKHVDINLLGPDSTPSVVEFENIIINILSNHCQNIKTISIKNHGKSYIRFDTQFHNLGARGIFDQLVQMKAKFLHRFDKLEKLSLDKIAFPIMCGSNLKELCLQNLTTRVSFWKNFVNCDTQYVAGIGSIEVLKLSQIRLVPDDDVDSIKIDKIGMEIFAPLMSMLSKLKHLEIRSRTHSFHSLINKRAQPLSQFVPYFLMANNSKVLETLIVDLIYDLDLERFPTKISRAIGNSGKYKSQNVIMQDLKTIEIEFGNLQIPDTIERLFMLIFGMNYDDGNISENTDMLESGGIELDIDAHYSKDQLQEKNINKNGKNIQCNIENLSLRWFPFNTDVCLTIFGILTRLTFPKLKQLNIENGPSTNELQSFAQCLETLYKIKQDTEKNRMEDLCIVLITRDGVGFQF